VNTAAGISDEGMDRTEAGLDFGKQRLQSRSAGNIGNDADSVAAKLRDGAIQRIPAPRRDDDPHACAAIFCAMAKPIPLLPPLTTATFLVSDVLTVLFLCSSLHSPRLPAVVAEEVDCWAVGPDQSCPDCGAATWKLTSPKRRGWAHRDA
jgi:hypothetical protein